MHFLTAILILAIVGFSIFSGIREVRVYRRARRGEPLLLVSRARLRRRLVISALLLIVAAFLFVGFFLLNSKDPLLNLGVWIPPLFLIAAVVYLSIQDFRETSRDLDRIMRDATDIARKESAKTERN